MAKAKEAAALSSKQKVALVAISEATPDKQLKIYREEIAEGANIEFEIDAHIAGRLSRGESTTRAPTCSLLNEAVLAKLIRRLGVTRQAFETALFETAMEAHVSGVPLREQMIAEDPSLMTAIELVKRDVIAKLPQREVAGSIKVIAAVELAKLKLAA